MEKELETMNLQLTRIADALEAIQEEWKTARKERADDKLWKEQSDYNEALRVCEKYSSRELRRRSL